MNFLACAPGRPVVSRMNGTRFDVWVPVKFGLLHSLAISPGFVLGADTRDALQEKGATIETSKYVIETWRLKTRSLRACSVCPLTTRVRAGTSAVTAFGQTWFGHPYLAAFGQFLLTEFGQTAFGQFCFWWGPGGVGARWVEAHRKFFSFFSLSGGFLVEFWW